MTALTEALAPPAAQHGAYHLRATARRIGLVVGCALLAACGGASKDTGAGPRPPGQLAMRRPEDLRSPGAAGPPLGALSPVDPRARERPSGATKDRPLPGPPPLMHVDDGAKRRPYALRDGALVVPGGLVIHRVPKGVSVRIAEERTGGEVWEIVDARARRLALLKAESWRRAGVPTDGAILDDTASVRSVVRPAVWGKAQVRVVTDRFHNDTHIYTLERRAAGTDWIWSGLDLSPNGSRAAP